MPIVSNAESFHAIRVVPSLVPGVYCTYTRSSHHFGKHWHDVYGFGLLHEGAQSWSSGRGQVAAYPGDVISTNPGEVHDGRPLGATTRDWRIVSVDPPTMSSFADLPVGGFEIAQPVVADQELARDVARLLAIVERHDSLVPDRDLGRLACEEALTDACSRLISRHGSRRAQPRTPAIDLSCVRDRLVEHQLRTPRLDELARMVGLSKFQVLRRFERQFGLPPYAWLLHYRAETARRLIRRGKTLADAAAMSGFADQSHMTRVFTRQYGYTPGVWKRAWT